MRVLTVQRVNKHFDSTSCYICQTYIHMSDASAITHRRKKKRLFLTAIANASVAVRIKANRQFWYIKRGYVVTPL